MKIKRSISAMAVCTIWICTTGLAQAQMSQYKFSQLFDHAFELVMDGRYSSAEQELEQLYRSDPEHAQVAYLLGFCQIKNGRADARTKMILAQAASSYDAYHQRGRVEDRTAPAQVWFYLAKVNAELGALNEAIAAYRNYMSCIPLASLDHKREVIGAIAQLVDQRNGKPDQQQAFANTKRTR